MNKLIILDRDGVINQDSDAYVKSLEEWIPIPGSIDAIARLSRAGYRVVVATNQSGLGRGYFQPADLEAMHRHMNNLVETAGGRIDGIFFCPHGPEDGCHCRKPAPGLIDQIETVLECTAAGAYMVGDSLRDLEAGIQRDCRPVLVRTGKGERTLAKGLPADDIPVYDDLAAFADALLGSCST